MTKEELKSVKEDFQDIFSVPDIFEKTAPVHQSSQKLPYPETYVNPQTSLIASMLGLIDPNAILTGKESSSLLGDLSTFGPEEISLDGDDIDDDVPDDDDLDTSSTIETPNTSLNVSNTSFNPDSTDIDNIIDDEEKEFIASTPKPSVLSLPKPVQENSSPLRCDIDLEPKQLLLSSQELDTSQDSSVKSPESEKSEAIEEESVKSSDSETAVPKKKFKRRNQSIYESKEED